MNPNELKYISNFICPIISIFTKLYNNDDKDYIVQFKVNINCVNVEKSLIYTLFSVAACRLLHALHCRVEQ